MDGDARLVEEEALKNKKRGLNYTNSKYLLSSMPFKYTHRGMQCAWLWVVADFQMFVPQATRWPWYRSLVCCAHGFCTYARLVNIDTVDTIDNEPCPVRLRWRLVKNVYEESPVPVLVIVLVTCRD